MLMPFVLNISNQHMVTDFLLERILFSSNPFIFCEYRSGRKKSNEWARSVQQLASTWQDGTTLRSRILCDTWALSLYRRLPSPRPIPLHVHPSTRPHHPTHLIPIHIPSLLNTYPILDMIKSDPTNSLLLRNYGKYLHEVEGDVLKAEEYYGRAILTSPGDGEVLSLYGKLIWETQRDESRAKSYFTQALQASPTDCMVLGSYAHFLREAEEEECEDDAEMETHVPVPATVEAF